MNHFPVARTANVVERNLDNETLIYDSTINKAYILNETSAFIWKQLDGQTSIADISRQLGAKFKQPANEDVVWLAIEQLKDNNVINDAKQINTPLAGSTRREAIKSIGLATMIALPLVTGLIAPQAAHAASLQAACGTCTTGAGCQSGVCSLGVCTNSSGGNRPRGGTYEPVTGPNCDDARSNCCSGSATYSFTPPFTRICTCQ